ncbi:protein PYRICULARIA ORYZAE RESISTANCE 21-like [Syzygium oleosum]|uniref:protein PYRICULARIA ORYZAE RESISTANCE 21-like n=1 Tax=Syzygium oleosum TaxID=219896 RepID=UPI0024BA95E8|nr:protein PYRICULARIA ORYZAE RESISTANCE 21-like [Syzygium oleosum]
MVEKVTRMLIKVDLQCSRCYKKIKKLLCKFPQIRDQIYDEKQNMVLIAVVCCSPEKIRQKIICKGGETVLSVEILPDKSKEPEKKPEKQEKPKDTKKPKDVIIEPPKGDAKPPAPKPDQAPPPENPQPAPPKPPQQPPAQPRPKAPTPMVGFPPVPAYPMVPVYPMVGVCCCPPYYGGYGGGPCFCGRRRPAMCYDGCGRPADECQGGNRGFFPGQGWPGMCYDGCGRPADQCQGGNRGSFPGLGRPVMCDDGCGRPACECPGGNRGYRVSRCDYFSEENATGCTVM